MLLTPRGFCAGVMRAIDVVRIALELYGPPIYVRKEIVHNRYVVEELRASGAVCVEEIDAIPEGARAIFSAHGVSPAVRRVAEQRRLKVIDATCPLVTKVHLEAIKYSRLGYTIVLIGHREHEEVVGTLGEAPESTVIVETIDDVDRLQVPDPAKVCYLTQTTLSLDETRGIVAKLRERFAAIQGPPAQDICYATQNRQLAVRAAHRSAIFSWWSDPRIAQIPSVWSKSPRRAEYLRIWWTMQGRLIRAGCMVCGPSRSPPGRPLRRILSRNSSLRFVVKDFRSLRNSGSRERTCVSPCRRI